MISSHRTAAVPWRLLAIGVAIAASVGLSRARSAASPAAVERWTARPSDKPTQSGVQRPAAAELLQYDRWQRAAARRSGVDWLLAAAVRIKESFNDPLFVSTTGAVGLMQLMPTGHPVHLTDSYRRFVRARRRPDRRYQGRSAAAWGRAYQQDLLRLVRTLARDELVRRDRRFDPRWNIERGTAHLARDLHRFARRFPEATPADLRRMAVAAYYAGPGRVRFRQQRVLLPSYVTSYVEDVLRVHGRLRSGLPGR